MWSLRWAKVNTRVKPHLWLGKRTACGLAFRGDPGGVVYSLTITHRGDPCPVCWAYAEGWVDRHVYGQRPRLGNPDPTGAETQLGEAS